MDDVVSMLKVNLLFKINYSYFVKDDREGGEIEQDTHKICWIIEKW